MTAYLPHHGELPRRRLGVLFDEASGQLAASLRRAYRAWLGYRSFRRTVWELERLSDRQLDDLGLTRSTLTTAIRGGHHEYR